MYHAAIASSSSSSSGSSDLFVLAIPFVVAIAFWVVTYRRYRNQDARHVFEETPSQVSNLRSLDQRVHHRTGLDFSEIEGRNDDDALAPIPIEVTGEVSR